MTLPVILVEQTLDGSVYATVIEGPARVVVLDWPALIPNEGVPSIGAIEHLAKLNAAVGHIEALPPNKRGGLLELISEWLANNEPYPPMDGSEDPIQIDERRAWLAANERVNRAFRVSQGKRA